MLLIKNAKILDAQSPYHGQTLDLLINKNGKIKKIGENLEHKKSKIWDVNGAIVSIGWLDVGTLVGDPGFEHKEDFESVSKAAAFGGFTGIACFPNTHPAIHSKTEVQYIIRQYHDTPVVFYPIGAVSRNCDGKDIAELYDMRYAGAVAFSDGKHPIQDSGLMLRSLQYVKGFNGVVMNQPHDEKIAAKGQVHEGLMSTTLGLLGTPTLAEEMMLQRDLYLTEYTDSRLHVHNVSSAEGLDLIRKGKAKGLNVTASVAVMNLLFDDTVLADFDTNYKVFPPLRETSDKQALHTALKDGTIDLICSNHTPQDEESKKLEFAYADYGVIALETAYAACQTELGEELTPEQWVEKVAINPRQLLDLDVPTIAENQLANLTVFNPDKEWTFTTEMIQSKSKNTPFTVKTFKGKALGVVNGGKYTIN